MNDEQRLKYNAYMREYGKKWRGAHREADRSYKRAWRLANPEKMEEARQSWIEKNPEQNQKRKTEYMRRLYAADPDRVLKCNAECRERIRDRIFVFLGDACVRCGFNDRRALQLDHINGDGYLDPGKGLWKKWAAFKRDKVAFKQKYQLLCANCNWIKRYENEEHTTRGHKRRV